MNKTIHIAQFAAGSRLDNIGDTTLFYSEGFSKRANDVRGIFLDNPPVLSPRHASLVWRYYKDVDRYMLMHVQGSHVVNTAMGRNYPFRAAYEVSRNEMNAIDFALTALFAAMPRIATMPTGRAQGERTIDVYHPPLSGQAEALAYHLLNALLRGERLYVTLPVPADSYRADGIFSAPELAVVLSAIEHLPLQLRRYATFGFCVDNRFSYVLDDVLLMVIPQDSGSQMVPAAQNASVMTWQQAVGTRPAVDQNAYNALQGVTLPGADSPLLPLDALHRAVEVAKKQPLALSADEWPIWLALGRQLTELKVESWPQLADVCRRMDAQTREKMAATYRKPSLRWSLKGFDEALLALMHYGDDEMRQLQRAALPAYLFSGSYAFLFKEGMNDRVKEMLDANLLSASTQQTSSNTPAIIMKWYDIYATNKRLGATGVQTLFKDLMTRYVAPQLSNLSDIVALMEKCPFVLATAFVQPAKVYMPQNMQRLAPEHKKLVEQWIRKAVDSMAFTSVDEVAKLMEKVNAKEVSPEAVELQALRSMKAKDLKALLVGTSQQSVVAACERLLAPTSRLPRSWRDFTMQQVLPAVGDVLFSSVGAMPREMLLDTHQWARLGPLKKQAPHVFALLAERLSQLFATAPYKAMADSVKKMRSQAALPIIDIFIQSLRKRNKNMANELEKQYKALRKSSRRGQLFRLIGCLVAGILVGAVLTYGGMSLYKWLSGPEKTEPTSGTSILWADNGQGNMMARLADMADWDNVSAVTVDTFSVKDLSFGQTADLLLLNQRYYASPTTPKTEPAKAVVYSVDEKGQPMAVSKADTLSFDSSHSLLSTVCSRNCRIGAILVQDTIVVDVPNKELTAADSTALSTKDARYYLRVVKYVQSRLPKGTVIAY